MSKRPSPGPFLWSGTIFIVCLALAFLATHREKAAIETGQFPVPPEIIGTPPEEAALPLLYFFGLTVVLGIVLFLVPLSKLRLVLRVVFGFAFSWGTFILLWLFSIPPWLSGAVALIIGLTWLLKPRIWLHDLLLVFTLVGMASIFGVIFSPWTVVVFMFVISIYDYLSVRFGYMQWMAQKLSESDTLPAFFIPRDLNRWASSITGPALRKIFEDAAKDRAGPDAVADVTSTAGSSNVAVVGPGPSAQKEVSVLGGGDIGFPLLLAVSVMYVYGIGKGLTVAAFSLLGLAAAYSVHTYVMKGRPTPALPPIFVLSLIGFLVVRFVL